MATQAPSADSWEHYYAATQDRPPRPLLVEALARVRPSGEVLDLGCGAGNDTRYLLSLGFHVTAVDQEAAALRALAPLASERLRLVESSFADFAFATYDLISAQLALPFNPPDTFPAMFARLKAALRPGGVFTGQLFGVHDAWNQPSTALTFHTRGEVDALLAGLEIHTLREEEEERPLATGGTKHWHFFHIVAQRPGA